MAKNAALALRLENGEFVSIRNIVRPAPNRARLRTCTVKSAMSSDVSAVAKPFSMRHLTPGSYRISTALGGRRPQKAHAATIKSSAGAPSSNPRTARRGAAFSPDASISSQQSWAENSRSISPDDGLIANIATWKRLGSIASNPSTAGVPVRVEQSRAPHGLFDRRKARKSTFVTVREIANHEFKRTELRRRDRPAARR